MKLSRRVLILEDEFLVADHLSEILQEAGHVVVGISASGAEALSVAAAEPIDVALLDIAVRGDMDGISVAERLHQQGIPFLYISGNGDPATRRRAEATRPLAFLQKPFHAGQLLAILADLNGKQPCV